MSRYARQITLEGWGREAQERLKASRVLIAGAGGLGSAAALYLLASGVGAVRLADSSRVSLSDLNHQVLYREQDLGKAKAAIAASRLKEINPFALVEPQVKAISSHNISRLTTDCHLLIDATNNSTAAFILNQAAARLRHPLVHAWVWDLNGRIATFWPGHGPCLACSALEIYRSGRPSLLGPLPGILGALQALESLRILGGLGSSLCRRILFFDGSSFSFKERAPEPNPKCPICQTPLPMRQPAANP